MRPLFFLAALIFVLTASAAAQSPSPSPSPSTDDELAQIAMRGRLLAAYDQAAWHATDALMAVVGKDTTGLGLFVVRFTPDAFIVDFGALDGSGKAFLTAYEATGRDTQHFTIRAFTPAQTDTGYLLAAAKAIQLTKSNFQGVSGHTYNYAVLPNQDGTLYVYWYPAQTTRIVPLGGDERFMVSPDGVTILEAHRMHRSILYLDPSKGVPGGSRTSALFHTDLFSTVPEDSDVFHVLASSPPVPEYVDAQNMLYAIDEKGNIRFVKQIAAPSPKSSP